MSDIKLVADMQKTSNQRVVTNQEGGFSLIEFLVAITLGLLLAAAATQLFFGGTVSVRLQKAGADIQDNGLFGMQFIRKDVRMINQGNTSTPQMTDSSTGGGVALTQAQVASTTAISTCLLTNGNGDSISGCSGNQWVGSSNVTGVKSDQLTIQFQVPPYYTSYTDCEGGQEPAGTQVIQRYFLRADTLPSPATDSALSNLVLVCNAGTITAAGVLTGSAGVGSFGGAGQVIMNRVDQFHILLGTAAQDGTNNMTYYTVNAYKNLSTATTPKPNIVSVQIAALVRSMDNTTSPLINPTQTFTLFDQTVTPVTTTTTNANRYMRQTYLTTVALRNGMGVATS